MEGPVRKLMLPVVVPVLTAAALLFVLVLELPSGLVTSRPLELSFTYSPER